MPRNDDEDDLYDTVSSMADRLKMKGKERDDYIHTHMTRSGYRLVRSKESYRKADDDDDNDNSSGWGRFGSSSRNRGRGDDDDRF